MKHKLRIGVSNVSPKSRVVTYNEYSFKLWPIPYSLAVFATWPPYFFNDFNASIIFLYILSLSILVQGFVFAPFFVQN